MTNTKLVFVAYLVLKIDFRCHSRRRCIAGLFIICSAETASSSPDLYTYIMGFTYIMKIIIIAMIMAINNSMCVRSGIITIGLMLTTLDVAVTVYLSIYTCTCLWAEWLWRPWEIRRWRIRSSLPCRRMRPLDRPSRRVFWHRTCVSKGSIGFDGNVFAVISALLSNVNVNVVLTAKTLDPSPYWSAMQDGKWRNKCNWFMNFQTNMKQCLSVAKGGGVWPIAPPLRIGMAIAPWRRKTGQKSSSNFNFETNSVDARLAYPLR